MVYVIIATALNRTDLLLERSLISVYNQIGLDPEMIKVLVVDDNETGADGLPATLETIRSGITNLKNQLNITKSSFETIVIPNARTKHSSGSGAWNTGIFHAFEQDPESFFAILDDDDEFLPYHIFDCLKTIANDVNVKAVFQELKWVNQDDSFLKFPLSIDQLTETTFYIGNPGIQGSNMFFRTAPIAETGGFDESIGGSTDRDLLIRFLRQLNKLGLKIESSVKIINTIGVLHHNHQGARVTSTNNAKHKALDRFYLKHRKDFTDEAYQLSLERAIRLFNYLPTIHE